MTNRISRRDVLRGLGIAGTGLLLRIDTDAQGQDLLVAGQPAELRVSTISPVTVRYSVFPRDRSFEQLNTDNAVVESADWRRVSAAAPRSRPEISTSPCRARRSRSRFQMRRDRSSRS